MNIYFLVEGFTESNFYPKLIEHLFEGKLSRVDEYNLATSNNYYLIGNGGYPFLYSGPKVEDDGSPFLRNAIVDINNHPVYDYLVMCLDADEVSVGYREEEFDRYIKIYKKSGIVLNDYCQYKLVVQNRCIETWFLGSKTIIKKNPVDEPLISYRRYYDIEKYDPEFMGNYNDVFSHQEFHHQYIRELFRARRLSYKKGAVEVVTTKRYISSLEKRVKDKHLETLNEFLNFCKYIKSKII